MSAATTPTTHTARRKAHSCSICGGPIVIGERYERWRYFDCGDAATVTVHPDCWQMFQDHDITEWTECDTWSEFVGELSQDEMEELVRGFTDGTLGRALKNEWDERNAKDPWS